MMKNNLAIAAALTFSFSALAARVVSAQPTSSAPAYGVIKTLTIGGDGGWDYLNIDPASHHLFVSRSTHVMVIDTTTGKVVGDIPGTTGVHGIAIDTKDNLGFTSNGKADSVTAFNLATFAPVKTVTVGTKPDAIVYDPASGDVFAIDGKSHDATAIDAATQTVKATIPLDGKPEFAATDGAGYVYVNIESKAEIQKIDTTKLSVVATWPIAPGESPSGLAIDPASHRLFSVCDNNVMAIVDTNTGKVVATPAIGNGPDACTFDPQLGLVFSPNGKDGTVTIIHEDTPDKYTVLQTVTTQKSARTFALDPTTHTLFMGAAQYAYPPAGSDPAAKPIILPDTFVILEVGPAQP